MSSLSNIFFVAFLGVYTHEGIFQQFHNLLNMWDVHGAAEILSEYAPQLNGIDFLILSGELAFCEGDYAQAVSAFERIPEKTIAEVPRLKEFYELSENMVSIVKDFEVIETEHFRIRYDPRQDIPFVLYLTDVLEAAYEGLSKVLGFRTENKILVEVMPDIQLFALASPLKEIEIRRTGTVALCKYAKIFITSPWLYSRGYHWADTANHELVHYVEKRLFGDTIPLWLNEGVAKHFETLWRGEVGLPQVVEDEYLSVLKRAMKEGRFIEFRDMYPSIAKLPSSEDAALAFAEVTHFTGWVAKKLGTRGLLQLLQAMATRGGKEDEAFMDVVGKSREDVLEEWRKALEKDVEIATEVYVPYQPRLRDKGQGDIEEAELNFSPKKRPYMRLGDLLMRQGFYIAAAEEYKKSIANSGEDVVVLNKLGLALDRGGENREAVRYFKKAYNLYPGLFTTNYRLGRAMASAGACKEAEPYLLEALYINPFHPEVHEFLLQCYEKKGDSSRIAREKRVIEFLENFILDRR